MIFIEKIGAIFFGVIVISWFVLASTRLFTPYNRIYKKIQDHLSFKQQLKKLNNYEKFIFLMDIFGPTIGGLYFLLLSIYLYPYLTIPSILLLLVVLIFSLRDVLLKKWKSFKLRGD